jgi:hypothetical protein
MSVTYQDKSNSSVQKITVAWTSDGSGDATVSLDAHGLIYRVVTNPGATAPTANYDIVINDADGVDVMAAALADRHTSTTEQVTPSAPPAVSGALSVVVSNAGDTKDGTVVLYVK